ncbi:MAG: Smr/MutS family protein [Polyangiaceae bacterium]|nr:Smr/MutS family protein [Polyangiaceae bacterium]
MPKKKRPKKNNDVAPPLPKFTGFRPLADRKELRDQLEAKKAQEEEARKEAQDAHESARLRHSQKLQTKPTTPLSSSSRASTADDELTFHRMMSGVAPLDRAGAHRVPVTTDASHMNSRLAESVSDRARTDAAEVRDHLQNLVDEEIKFEITEDGKRAFGRRADTSPSLLHSLQRGMLPIDARLDLHGLTTARASERVVDFLRQMRASGERCVLIIHGKGDYLPGGGVLRGEIVTWLSQGRARKYVAAFATAVARDGGEGAVYVALRR